MKKNYFIALLALMLVLPFSGVKAQVYNTADSLTCQAMMATNFTAGTLLNWNDPNPGNWIGVTWDGNTPQRITDLNLNESSCNTGANNGTYDPTGTDIQMTGVLNLMALTELQVLEFRQVAGITGITVTGLNNLTTITGAKSGLTTLDVSGLTGLTTLRVKNCAALTNINAANCTALTLASLRGNSAAYTMDFSGCTSLLKIAFPDGGATGLDLSGCILLNRIKGRQNNLTSVDLTGCVALNQIGLSQNQLTSIDVTGMALLATLGIKDNQLTEITGITALNNLTTLNANDNKMELTEAVESSLVPVSRSAGNSTNGVENQKPYNRVDKMIPDSVEYTPHELINVNATPVASSFQLLDNTMTPVGAPNATGKFTFLTQLDTGLWYVEMSNSGVTITTDSIVIADCTLSIDTSTTSGVNMVTSNEVGAFASYQWIDCNNGNAYIVGETGVSYTATISGDYAVEITNGCSVDTSACVNIVFVGIDELGSDALAKVYPNPVKDVVTIELAQGVEDVTISIMNVEGKMVYNDIRTNNTRVMINSSDWTRGIYIVKVFNDKYTKTIKLIK